MAHYLNGGSPIHSIGGAALVVAIAGIASRILGLVRDRVLASTFGAGDVLDVYYAAFRIPDLVFDLLVLGALGAAFVPVFMQLMEKQKMKEAWELASGILTLLIVIVMGVSVLFMIFAPSLMHIIVPGFTREKLELTTLLTRIMFLSPLFLGISAVFGGILISFKRFLIYSLAPLMYNVGIIIGALFFVDFFGPVGLAWGVVFGAFLHMLAHYPAARHTGFSYTPLLRRAIGNPHVRRVMKLMVPRILGSSSSQLGFLVIAFFTSTLASGSLTVFMFANNIQSVVLGLIGVPFALAAFPMLSELRAKESETEFVALVSKTLRRILFYVIPASVFFIIFRAQIVRVVLGSGSFDWEDTILTFQVLGFLAVSLFAQSSIPLLARTFYAMQDTKTPFYIALGSQIVNVIAVMALITRFDVIGVAIAFSFSSIVNMGFLLFFLKKKLHTLDGRHIMSSTLGIILATSVAAIVAQSVKYVTGTVVELETFVAVFSQLVIAGGAGVVTYLFISAYLSIEEFYTIRNKFFLRVFGKTAVIAEEQKKIE
ncbi:MAG TPA: murein biosynthesis integral membrane protein MurJ [Patescibacteria group bacterium]|nr:murein biosynthesis integral membrane protein MurJ [Patescibacteria group bacterium]